MSTIVRCYWTEFDLQPGEHRLVCFSPATTSKWLRFLLDPWDYLTLRLFRGATPPRYYEPEVIGDYFAPTLIAPLADLGVCGPETPLSASLVYHGPDARRQRAGFIVQVVPPLPDPARPGTSAAWRDPGPARRGRLRRGWFYLDRKPTDADLTRAEK